MEKQHIIQTRDGKDLFATLFIPKLPNGQTVVIGAGAGIRRQFYGEFAGHLCQAGYLVYTFDYRGVGQSKPSTLQGFSARLQEWGMLDLDSVVLDARRLQPNNRLIYVAHSLGAQIVGLAPAAQYFSRMVLIAGQIPYWRLWSMPYQSKMFLLGYVLLPGLSRWWGYFPGKRIGLGFDLPKGVALEWARWIRHPEGLFGYLPEHNYRKIDAWIRAYSFTDDEMAPKQAVRQLLQRFPRADIKWRHIDPSELKLEAIGHFGFFKKKRGGALWAELLQWLDAGSLPQTSRETGNPPFAQTWTDHKK